MGELPAANGFVDAPDGSEPTFPLKLVRCSSCSHVQLQHTVSRKLLFSDYMYFATDSGSISEHFKSYSEMLEQRYLADGDFVVDVGSNDGGLLASLPEDVDRVGIEPAENVAEVARERGVPTVTEFFDVESALQIREEYAPAAVITANNVLAHIDDLHEVLRAVDVLLAADGVFVVEVPYLVDLLAETQVSTIYHEHLSYFSVASLRTLVDQHGMMITDIERLDRHGGSIRVHVQRTEAANRTTYVDDLLNLERVLGVSTPETLSSFAERAQRKRDQIHDLISERATNHSIVGYGASAKGNVLLSYCGLDSDDIQYVVDAMPAKQGTYTPGTNIPVRPPETFREDSPDYAVLLAWNYRDLIYEKESDFRAGGGRFIVPTPNLDIRN
jgi:SAM-dependent methyltransferase